jgi:hypothetical protein
MIKKFAIIFVLIFSFANFAQAQTLPTKIKSYLDKNYKGWKISPTPSYCGGGKSIVSGDFNGDKKRDYAAKIFKGKKGYVIAFMARKDNYTPFLFHNMTAEDTKNTALLIYQKGEKYYTELGEESSAIILKNDALYDSPCESDAGGIHLFRNGKFEEL